MWGHYDLQVSKVDPPVVTCKLYYNDAGDADHLQSIEATFDDPGSYTQWFACFTVPDITKVYAVSSSTGSTTSRNGYLQVSATARPVNRPVIDIVDIAIAATARAENEKALASRARPPREINQAFPLNLRVVAGVCIVQQVASAGVLRRTKPGKRAL